LSLPRLILVYDLEASTPQVIVDAEHESDAVRLADWVTHSRHWPMLSTLVPDWCGVATGAAA
jgi:hypothetical protein